MNCPICNNKSFSEWGRVGTYSIVKCMACGLGITSPFPTKEELTKSNIEIYAVEKRVQTYLSRQRYFERRYKIYIKNIQTIKKNGSLLDIGCNIGLFLNVAHQAGFTVFGVEFNKGCADYGRKYFNLDIYSDYLEALAFPDKSFDVITLFDVLEHIPDMHGFMSEVRRVLKRDGLLVLQSPNIDSAMANLTKSKWSWLTPPDHLYHFTPETMIRFLSFHGFSINKVKTWEPAEDFSNNLIEAYQIGGFIGKGLNKILMLTKIVEVPILLLQKYWWSKQKGGLIEIYACKNESLG